MSVFWLLPQCFLLGLMEGLASKGLEKFISNHVSKSIRRYGPTFSNFVTGKFGKFLQHPLRFTIQKLVQGNHKHESS